MFSQAIRFRWILFFVVFALASVFTHEGFAQASGSVGDKPDNSEAEPVVDLAKKRLRSPRSAAKTFLDAMNQDDKALAATCLDLTETVGTEDTLEDKGQEFAYKLKDTIDRIVRVELSEIPDDPEMDGEYGLHESQPGIEDALMFDASRITIARSEDGLWRFSARTIHELDDLWERAQGRKKVAGLEVNQATKPVQVWVREQFPAALREKRFLLRDYQWICLAGFIFVGFVADFLVRTLLHVLTSTWFRYVRKPDRRDTERRTWRPVALLAQALVWYFGCKLIDLPPGVLTVLTVAMKSFTVFAGVWTFWCVIDLVRDLIMRRSRLTGAKLNELFIDLVAKTFKTIVLCIGLIICFQLFDRDVWGLLGGLGIGGIAIALAAKDALGNLFGSMTIVLDRPFEIGDWIVTEDVEGTVESVGMRSTRIRTFYNSQIILPNNRLTTAIVDNMGRRRFRRIREVLGLEYNTTPDQMDAFCEGVRELIRRHPYTRKDYFHVYFNGYGDSALNVLLYCFLDCPDWATELREKHRLLADIFRLATELKIGFAFPTQTLHLHRGQAPEEFSIGKSPEESGRLAAAEITAELTSDDSRPAPVKIA